MIPGVTLNLGGVDYVLPPLALSAVEMFQDRLSTFMSGGVVTVAEISLVVDVIHAALKRNYPDIARQTVADNLDMANFGTAFQAVMGVSGLVGGSAGEPAAAA